VVVVGFGGVFLGLVGPFFGGGGGGVNRLHEIILFSFKICYEEREGGV